MHIGVPLETHSGETRVAATPETVKKLIGQGHRVTLQSGAGLLSSVPDSAYEAVGATIGDAAAALAAELVLKVNAPDEAELEQMQSGSVLLGMLNPFDNDCIARMAARGITAFALEAAPRTSRAQSLDVLSSQANIAGYKAVLVGAHHYPRFMPMLMTAAGTVKAARVLILGRCRRAAGHRHGQAPGCGGRGFGRAPGGEGADRIARRQVRRRAAGDRRGA